jgi:hypothetical protein
LLKESFLPRGAAVSHYGNNTMTIIKDVQTNYVPSPSRLAQSEVRQELDRLKKVDLAEQNLGIRSPILIGSTTTYWAIGLSKISPLFLEHSPTPSGGIKRVHLLRDGAVAVYDRREKGSWERRALLPLGDAATIIMSLPKKSFSSEVPTALASPSQMSVIKKCLDLPASEPMAALTMACASRLIDRITVERDIAELVKDADEWLGGPTPE